MNDKSAAQEGRKINWELFIFGCCSPLKKFKYLGDGYSKTQDA